MKESRVLMADYHPHDRVWLHQQTRRLIPEIRDHVINSYSAEYRAGSRRDANLWMLGLADRLEEKGVQHLSNDDDNIRAAAKLASQRGRVIAEGLPPIVAYEKLCDLCLDYSVEPPVLTVGSKKADFVTIGRASIIAVKKLSSEKWWRAQLRKAHARGLEAESINLGMVSKKAGIYCSDITLKTRRQQRARNRELADLIQMVCKETGEAVRLAEIIEHSLANPSVRRSELMVRIRGFDDYAVKYGHTALFFTLTLPSKYHRFTTVEGPYGKRQMVDNPKWKKGELSPREGQDQLTSIWRAIRSKLKRDGLPVYGFRVAEPHHDGCPHWHMLFFMQPDHVDDVKEIIRSYALKEDGDEPGAKEYRLKVEVIDPAKGSATGYIAKYIAKSIDGFAIDADLFGNDPKLAAERIEAWARRWGIRQFQQIGGPPVGLWRLLRKIDRIPGGLPDVLMKTHSAADKPDYCAFLEALGGPLVPRSKLPLKVAKWKKSYVTEFNAHGDIKPPKVIGVDYGSGVMPVRQDEWIAEVKENEARQADIDFEGNSGFKTAVRNGSINIRRVGTSTRGQVGFYSGLGYDRDSSDAKAAKGLAFKWDWYVNRDEIDYPVAWNKPPVCPLPGYDFKTVFEGVASEQSGAASSFLGCGEAAPPWSSVNNCTRQSCEGVENDESSTTTGEGVRAGVENYPDVYQSGGGWPDHGSGNRRDDTGGG
ncbi:MAG: replication endonuclease [Candidatus Thiodiazotropha endolucinida]